MQNSLGPNTSLARSITGHLVMMLVRLFHVCSCNLLLNSFILILGGTEDILSDLGVRQAMKKMPKDARL